VFKSGLKAFLFFRSSGFFPSLGSTLPGPSASPLKLLPYAVMLPVPGPDLLQAGSLLRKNVGPLIYEYSVTPPPQLPSPAPVGADTHSSHHRHFAEDPCCNAHCCCSKRLCVNHQGTLDAATVYDASGPHKIGSLIIFPNHIFQYFWLIILQKNEKKSVILWGPPFRPRMLNMPKSASALCYSRVPRSFAYGYTRTSLY